MQNFLGPRENQYDKAEELITWYMFAPLVRMRQSQRIETVKVLLGEFAPDVLSEPSFEIYFEKLLPSPTEYIQNLQTRVSQHPVRYVRQEAERHLRENLRLEGSTHLDLFIESKKLLIPVEAKFTSDISQWTTYEVERNQIARDIDVTLEEARKSSPPKNVIFLLCIPERFAMAKTGLYNYKLEEYKIDRKSLARDLKHRSSSELELVIGIGYITWEQAAKTIYQNAIKYDIIDQMELNDLREFFTERLIRFEL